MAPMSARGDVTSLLSAWRGGDRAALEKLIPIVYDDLRRVAARCMRSQDPGHTLQTTALVHEAYMRLTREQDRTWENRAQFFGMSAQIMRNLLVDHARAAAAAKRGGRTVTVVMDDAPEFTTVSPEDLLALDDALKRLAEFDPRGARIVELRFFVGLTTDEVAQVMGISEKTVKRDWSAAKSLLRTELRSRK